MEQKEKLTLVEQNHDEILDAFENNKDELHEALDSFFSAWLQNPFDIEYTKQDLQKHFELYASIKKQVSFMEYMPNIQKKLDDMQSRN